MPSTTLPDASPFTPGDVVCLRSGSELVTVKDLCPETGVLCVWWNPKGSNEATSSAWLSPVILKKATQRELYLGGLVDKREP